MKGVILAEGLGTGLSEYTKKIPKPMVKVKKKFNFYKKIEKNFYGIFKACNYKFYYSCGSYLTSGKSYKYDQATLNKQLLLFDIAKKHNKVLEIGVYMAHSILIMLSSNPKLNIYGIDIDKKYALPSMNYLQKKFPKSKLKFLEGDSIKILKKLIYIINYQIMIFFLILIFDFRN